MLMIGDHNNIPYNSNTLVFNYTSLVEGYTKLEYLVPMLSDQFNTLDETQFDMLYANYVLSNPMVFNQLMQIVMPLYDNKDVYVIVQQNYPYLDMLNESLMKLIQQRYGYNYFIINSTEDYMEACRVDPNDYSFNIQGIYNLDNDKELFIRNRLAGVMNGDQPIPEGQLY